MKSVVRIAIGIAVIVIGWFFWPEATDSSTLTSAAADQAATPATAANSPSPGTPSPQQSIETGNPAQTCPSTEQLGTSLQQLQQQRVSLTNQLIDLHIKLGIKMPVTLQMLQAVGGDLEVFQYRQSAEKNLTRPFLKTTSIQSSST